MARQTPGNYVPLDVNYARDIAVRKAGTNAELLYIRSLAYAKGARTSGFVSDFDLEVVAVGMRAVKAAAEKLCKVGLWVRVDDGWQIRSWERWNASDRIVSAGGKLGNHKRWHVERGAADPDCEFCTDHPPIAPRSHPESPPNRGGESQGKGREGKKNTSSTDVEAAFAEFYDAYPRKVGRKDALKAFEKALKDVPAEKLIEASRRYAADPNQPADKSKIPHPATWLNQGRWDDEPLPQRLDQIRLPEPGEHLPSSEVERLIGPDYWSPGPAPEGFTEDEAWEWERQQRIVHIANRQRLARERMAVRA